jgi:hypothetical protein
MAVSPRKPSFQEVFSVLGILPNFNTAMEVDKSEIKILHRALDEWQQSGELTDEQARSLKETIVVKQSAEQIAQYFFFIALFCILMAFGAIFLNEKLLEKIKAYFSLSDLMIAIISGVLAVLWFWYTGRKRAGISPAAYEVYMVLGGLAILTSLVYFCKDFGIDKTNTALLSLSLPLLVVVAQALRSKALWIGAIITAIGWFGSFSTWQSHDNLFMGMNYPMRYTVFGLVVLGIAFLQAKVKLLWFGQRITYSAGLIIVFTGLWGISIFGNYNTLEGWQQVRQIHVLAYSIIFGLAAALSFYLGIRFKDETARDMGVLFLLINLYTRYFEYFWDTMNKGIFFLVLAVTFGFVGWWLERKRKPHKVTSNG